MQPTCLCRYTGGAPLLRQYQNGFDVLIERQIWKNEFFKHTTTQQNSVIPGLAGYILKILQRTPIQLLALLHPLKIHLQI